MDVQVMEKKIDGTIYFKLIQFNRYLPGLTKTKVMRKWYHPGLIKAMQDSVPNGWEVRVDSQGLIYYFNQTNRSTTWYHPSELGGIDKSNLRIRPFSYHDTYTVETYTQKLRDFILDVANGGGLLIGASLILIGIGSTCIVEATSKVSTP